jgi:hypothetical protein
MTQPTGYPLPPEQIPPGYGYPQPPKKTGTAVRALAAIFGLALVVLAGIGVKTTFFDKKSGATGVSADPTSNEQLSSQPTAGGTKQSPRTSSAITLPTDSTPAGSDPLVPQPPVGPGIAVTDYRPEAIKPYLESVMTQPGLAGFSKQTLIDMGAYACGYLSANDDTPQNLEAGVAAGLSLSRPDGARITDAAALTMCTQFRGKVMQ